MEIRQAQLDEFEKSLRRALHLRILKSLGSSLPEIGCLDQATLLDQMERTHQIASNYGIRTEYGITCFIKLSLLAGPNFHESPAIHRYLNTAELTGDQKLRLLINLLEFAGRKG